MNWRRGSIRVRAGQDVVHEHWGQGDHGAFFIEGDRGIVGGPGGVEHTAHCLIV